MADYLDALTSDRAYRTATPLDEVVALIQQQSGTAFDPAVVEALTTLHDKGVRAAAVAQSCSALNHATLPHYGLTARPFAEMLRRHAANLSPASVAAPRVAHIAAVSSTSQSRGEPDRRRATGRSTAATPAA